MTEGKLPRVGFIGLGVMGGPMARHIMNAGFELTVFSKTKSKVDAMAAFGAKAASSAAEVAANCDIILSCLPENETVREVLFTNENSAAMGAKPGTILVDTSTIAPAAAQEFAERANELGLHFLDAPLTGGQIGAENGTLTIMVGGNEEVFGKVKPVFEPMSKKIVYVGGPGMGQILKMANQIAGMLNVVGVAEALLFCRNAGVDLDLAVETLSGGASGSWAMENLGPRIVDRDFRPGFSAELQQKDLRYALETADKLKVPMPGTAVCNQLMRSVLAHGDGKLSFVAVSLVLERLAGLDLPIKKGK